jgi:UDP-N-acetylmuramyl pentapeptide phosphotransferase/UDP-N-acetylglucosamine-1-phosphate transferase
MPFLLALALGLVLTPLLARVGLAVGLVDHPTGDGLKIHAEPKPLTGGLAVATAALTAIAVAGERPELLAVAAVLLLLALGVADDVMALPPLVRLLLELLAGGMLAASGATFAPLGAAGRVAVVLAVPAVVNAVNIVDGQDGLAGGLTAVAAAGLTAILAAQGDAGALGPALVASLLAFLLWNRPPARVFLGDGGTYAVGGALVLLAASASASWEALVGVVVCLGVFAFELGSTMIRRAINRESLVGGDRAHVYDLLSVQLASRTRATAAMIGVGVTMAALGFAASEAPLPVAIGIAAVVGLAGSVGVVVLWRRHRGVPRRSR